jgi:hypothetical protein
MTLTEAYAMAYFSAMVLVIYLGLQSGLSLAFGRDNPPLKLLLEPFLLCLGLILHVHWVKVTKTFQEHALRRPRWISAADALSFMISFWAVWCIVEAFLQRAHWM